jgi:hypothetical protein
MWQDNYKHGEGTQTYTDGGVLYATYEGSFTYNKRNGEGTLTYASGQVLSGTWADDSFLG